METNKIPYFIVIDDDPVSNDICRQVIRVVHRNAAVRTFDNPMDGLMFLLTLAEVDERRIVLFLDINMPGFSGWDIVGRLQSLPADVQEKVDIHILSSSVAIADKNLADANDLVNGFVEKPLTVQILRDLLAVRYPNT